MLRKTGIIIVALAAACLLLAAVGIRSIEVEPGHVGYVYHKPLFLSGGGFVQVLPGPARWGVSWRKYVTPIDVSQFTMDEQFEILAKDDLMIKFRAHAMLSVKPDEKSVREVVEKYYGEEWYREFFMERFRSKVYDAAREFDSRAAKENRSQIGTDVLAAMRETCKDTPFIVQNVVIGNIVYPDVVQKAVEQKLAAQQELERASVRVEIAKQDALVKVAEAEGVAKAQEIINQSLTTNYIRHEYVTALMECAKQPNTTIIYVPVGADGLPVIADVTPQASKGK